MNIDLSFKVIRLTTFMFAVLQLAGAAEASGNVRKGLPVEMLISAEELRQRQLKGGPMLILDARDLTSYKKGHIAGSILPLTPEYYQQDKLFKQGMLSKRPDADAALAENVGRYHKSTPIVAYCTVGCQSSAALIIKIKRLGFSDLKDMEEGFDAWQQKGYPVSK